MGFRKQLITGIALSFLLVKGFGQAIPVRYFNPPVVEGKTVEVRELVREFGDSTLSNIVYQNLGEGDVPISYAREIKTSVCFDGKCRLLDILLYWNPVGGYLGFELPEGEFLSKTDHDPFSADEYLRLHRILSDSLSPLADYTFEELVPGTGNPDEVDAVSSATLKDILDYIVPGAAYTTYRLWHLVYGKTTQEVSKLSDDSFSEKFALALLGSRQAAAQIWALNRLDKLAGWSNDLTGALLRQFEDDNLNVVVTAISDIPAEAIDHPDIQAKIFGIIAGGDYAFKKMSIVKLKEARAIQKRVKEGLVNLIPELNGDLLGELLNLFIDKEITETDIQRKVSEVLLNGNRYTGGKALDFLKKLNPEDELVKSRMKDFTQRK